MIYCRALNRFSKLSDYSVALTTRLEFCSARSEILPSNVDFIANLISGEISDDAASFSVEIKNLAAKKVNLNLKEKQFILSTFLRLSKHMDTEILSNCVWSLGMLRCSMSVFDNSPPNMIAFKETISMHSKDANIIELYRLVSGLDKLGFSWKEFPGRLQTAFMSSLSKGRDTDWNRKDNLDNDSRAVSSVVYMLGHLNVTVDSLSDEFGDLIITRVAQSLTDVTSQGVANIMHGISKMGFRWHEFSTSFKVL